MESVADHDAGGGHRAQHGRTTIIVAGGPSAGSLALDRLRGRCRVIAVNDSFRRLPWADVVFTADGSWLKRRWIELLSFPGRIVAALPAGYSLPLPLAERQLTRLHRLDGAALNDDPGVVHYADNSGFGALAYVACHECPQRILLAGYDLKGPGHWHGGYPWPNRFVYRYDGWASAFAEIANGLSERGIDVVNLNSESAIRCFRFGSLADACI